MVNSTTKGKHGYGARVIAGKYNSMMLNSPNYCKISNTALQRAVAGDTTGQSPAACGRPQKIPRALYATLAKQSAMLQVAGEGEASSSSVKMRELIEGLGSGTKWEGEYTTRAVWRKTLTHYPEVMNPVKAKPNEDRRVEWLSYKNIMEWTKRAKAFLIDIGMAKDEPGIIREPTDLLLLLLLYCLLFLIPFFSY